MFRQPSVLTMVLLVLPKLAFTQESVTLRASPAAGIYTATLTTDSAITIAGATSSKIGQRAIQRVVTELTLEPLGAAGQPGSIAYKRFRHINEFGAFKETYDSADPKSKSAAAESYQQLLAMNCIFRLDEHGRPGKFVNEPGKVFFIGDKLVDPRDYGDMFKPESEQRGEILVRQWMLDEFLPPRPVTQGSTWTAEGRTPGNAPGDSFTMLNTCQLVDLVDTTAGRVAVIEFTGKSTGNTIKSPLPGLTIESFDVQSKGTAQLNLKTGLMEKTETSLQMTVVVANVDGTSKATQTVTTKATHLNVPGKYVAPKIEP